MRCESPAEAELSVDAPIAVLPSLKPVHGPPALTVFRLSPNNSGLVSEVRHYGYREGRLLKPAVKVCPLNLSIAKGAFQIYSSLACHRCLGILA